ncbi:MAG: hypothetical protein ACFFC7_34290 [Candidatus Hermodarchaeota archaeon]
MFVSSRSFSNPFWCIYWCYFINNSLHCSFLFQYFLKAKLDERKAKATAMKKIMIEINDNLFSLDKYGGRKFLLLDDVLTQLIISGEINLVGKPFEDQLHKDIMFYRCLLNIFNQTIMTSEGVPTDIREAIIKIMEAIIVSLKEKLGKK